MELPTPALSQQVLISRVSSDIDYLKRSLYEEANQFLYAKKYQCHGLTAWIESKREPSLRQLTVQAQYYTSHCIVVEKSIQIGMTYYGEREEMIKILKDSFVSAWSDNQPWHYNVLYLYLIHHKETNIIDIYSILYEQDTDCLVQETISHLELLKSQSPEEISNYLMRQSLQFRCINQ
jgi:hypothetical protein